MARRQSSLGGGGDDGTKNPFVRRSHFHAACLDAPPLLMQMRLKGRRGGEERETGREGRRRPLQSVARQRGSLLPRF